jgi:FemAB-related protein (PEP-CTERM system-associated)
MPAVTSNDNAPLDPHAVQQDQELSVRPWTPEDAKGTDELCREFGGSLFQRSAWLDSVSEVFGHLNGTLVACRGTEFVGLLPIMFCRGLFGGRHLISTPYGVYGGPLAKDEEALQALIDGGLKVARQLDVGRLELRSAFRLDHPDLHQSDRYVTFVKDLPGSTEEVLKGMKKDERRLVRRASDTHGLVLDEGPWFVEDLARLFHSSKQRLGSPGLPAAWFRTLLDKLGDEVVIHIVRRENEVLAVSMCFVDGDELRMYYIGTTPEANREYATTSFMIAELQSWAIARGLRRFDLGRSRSDAGAVKFKKNQGFTAEPLHYAYGFVRSTELPSFTPSNPRTAWLREIWTRLPAWLCVRLSGYLARFLP